VVAVVLLLLTKPLQYLPRGVLGALVFVTAIRLIKLRTIVALRRESPGEFGLALVTAGVVVGAGVEQGILLAMVLSLLRIVRNSYRPHTGVLVQNPLGSWDMIPVLPDAVTEPGLVIYRFGAELFYANANLFAEEAGSLAGPAPSPVNWLIVDGESISRLDYSAAGMMRELQQNLLSRGTQLGFARLPVSLKSDFERHHLTEVIDPTLIFNRLHDALAAFEKLHSS
jgi:SulP family sulfate permease